MSWNILSAYYQRAFLAVGWQEGLMSLPEVQKAEENICKVWLDCLSDTATFKEFKVEILKWEDCINAARKRLTKD